jgi:hypothetical protein
VSHSKNRTEHALRITDAKCWLEKEKSACPVIVSDKQQHVQSHNLHSADAHDYHISMKHFSNKIIVIGKGRFGNAIAQGLREGFIESEDGTRAWCKVVQVSATSFTSLPVSEMADELKDTAFVVYCGKTLSEYAGKFSLAIQLAITLSLGPALEFIDFSNPDPTLEKADVTGAIDLWVALNAQASKNGSSLVKVWKITELGSVDASGIVGNTGKSSQMQF